LDGLPAATKKFVRDHNGNPTESFETGFKLGFVEDGATFLNNHVDIKILFHTSPEFTGRRIVRFEVQPKRF